MTDAVAKEGGRRSRSRPGRLLKWGAAITIGVLSIGAIFVAAERDAPEQGNAGASARTVSVRLAEIERGPVVQWLFAEGVAQAARKDFLQFERSGRVELITADADGEALREGSRVTGPAPGDRFGQLIARLDDRESAARVAQVDAQLAAAQRRVESARAALDQARQEFERQSRLAERGLTPEAERERVEAAFVSAEAQLREAEAQVDAISAQADEARIGLEQAAIFAPFDGVISLMNIREGDYVTGEAPDPSDRAQEANAAVVVLDDSRFEVTLHLPPYEAALVEEGQRAYVALTGDRIAEAVRHGDEVEGVVGGRVWSVSPSISLQRRAVTVKVRVEGAAAVLRDGAFVSVWIAAAEEPSAVRAPYTALIQRAEETFVFAYDAATGRLERRVVTLGLLGLDAAQVPTGLSAGEQVVTEGHHRLSDGAIVRPIASDPSDEVAAADREER